MKIYNYIKLILFIVFSVLLFIFREELIANINFFIGSLIIAFGLENVIVLAIVEKKNCFRVSKFSFSIFEIVLGVTILSAVNVFSYVCVMWAVWSLLRQSIDIHEVFQGEIKGVFALLVLIESIVSIVFGILLIINPTEHHAMSHIYLLIAELMVIALPPVLDELIFRVKQRKENN